MVVMLTTQVERGRVGDFNFQRKGLETELRVILFSTQLMCLCGNELQMNIFINIIHYKHCDTLIGAMLSDLCVLCELNLIITRI